MRWRAPWSWPGVTSTRPQTTLLGRGIAMAFLVWSVVTMMHSAMRLVAPQVAAVFESLVAAGLSARVLGTVGGESDQTDLRHLAELLHDSAKAEIDTAAGQRGQEARQRESAKQAQQQKMISLNQKGNLCVMRSG